MTTLLWALLMVATCVGWLMLAILVRTQGIRYGRLLSAAESIRVTKALMALEEKVTHGPPSPSETEIGYATGLQEAITEVRKAQKGEPE